MKATSNRLARLGFVLSFGALATAALCANDPAAKGSPVPVTTSPNFPTSGLVPVAAKTDASKDTYYLSDYLSTTIGTVDAGGEIDQMETDAFGAPLAAGRPATRYTGKPYDEDMEAYIFPFRNYRPDEARWMTPDPSGFPDGVNNSRYAPTPTISVDVFGLTDKLVLVAVVNQYGAGHTDPGVESMRSGVTGDDPGFINTMNTLDSQNLGYHYLDDGDVLDFVEIFTMDDLSTIGGADYTRVYVAAHGAPHYDPPAHFWEDPVRNGTDFSFSGVNYSESDIGCAVGANLIDFEGCYSSHNPNAEISSGDILHKWFLNDDDLNIQHYLQE